MSKKIVLYYNDLVFSPSDAFLSRDFGQVPYVLADKYGLDVEFWIATKTRNHDYHQFRGKTVRQFSKLLTWLPDRFDFLRNWALYRAVLHMHDMSHLVLFPFTPLTDYLVARLAKWRRPTTSLIVKLDTNAEFLGAIAADWRRGNRWTRPFRQSSYYRRLLKLADAVICETTACQNILRSDFLGLDLAHKLARTFSGVSRDWLSSMGIDQTPDRPRRNAIIVSGRLSIWIKYTSLIFEAGPPPPGWTIEFVGDIDVDLERIVAQHRAANPDFDRQYRFHGVITDKRRYYDILMGGRALLMNSRGPEGFPNVYADAHFCGLFIVTSDIASSYDATANGRWGLIYRREDVAALRAALDALPDRIAAFDHDGAVEEYRCHFIWEDSLAQPAIERLFPSSSPINRLAKS